MEVQKLNVINLAIYLVVYIGMHYLIYYLKTEMENKGVASAQSIKNINMLYKWFPALYVVIMLVTMI